MLRLRPYKKCDAEYIVKWIKDEVSFRKWCADRYEAYPISAEDINKHYEQQDYSDAFYPMTAFDESGVVGHLIMRFTDEAKHNLRFGFIIVDDSKRGKGYGKEMLKLAAKYAFDILKVDRISLGVFENNPQAHNCYKAAGFCDKPNQKDFYIPIMGENWKCIEMEIYNDKGIVDACMHGMTAEDYHKCKIKAVEEAQLTECVNVIRESFLTVADEFGFTVDNAPRFTAFATDIKRLNWQLNNEHRPMFAYFDKGAIVGYYSLLLQENNECELNNVCVLPQYRHKGIGEALLEHAFNTAKEYGCAKMNIGIVEENKVLRQWYEKYGFVHIGTKKYDFFPFTCGYMELTL